MQIRTTFCDICGVQSNDVTSFEVKWCNDHCFSKYDVCPTCFTESKTLTTKEESYELVDTRHLGLLRFLFKKKKIGGA